MANKLVLRDIRRLEFYIAGGSKTTEMCCEMGNDYYRLKDYANAEKWFKEALALDMENMEAYLALAELYKMRKEYEKLRDMYYQLSLINPYDPDLLRELGWAYYYCEDYKNAIGTLEKVKIVLPGDTHTRYSLGLFYINEGYKAKAVEEYKELKKLDEKKADDLFDYIYPENEPISMDDFADRDELSDDVNEIDENDQKPAPPIKKSSQRENDEKFPRRPRFPKKRVVSQDDDDDEF